jgi:catechol 2,3-dioxygenase-like lactoylglutathione lyase family enzyme
MKLHHVAINVSNIKKSVEWYVENMHATVDYEDDTWAMLCFGDVKMALTVASQHPPHIGFEVSGFEELGIREHKELKTHRDGSYYLYLEDPDGNVLEKLYWDE